MATCPHCGSVTAEGPFDPSARAVIVNGERRRLSPREWRVLDTLRRARGNPVATEVLIDSLWGDDPDGGPLDARNIAHQLVRFIRRALAGSGISIETHYGHGYRLVGEPGK